MASGSTERAVLSVDHVTVECSSGEKLPDCSVFLSQNQITFVVGGVSRLSIPLTRMKSIDIHQPIFGANYIIGEFLEQGTTHSVTMTFSKGGATDFARTFFRLTEGRLMTDSDGERQQETPQTTEHDKKNK